MKRALAPSRPGQQSRIVLYTTENGKVTVDVFFLRETFWLTQRAISELFGVQVPAISKHLKNIYESGELVSEAKTSPARSTSTTWMRSLRWVTASARSRRRTFASGPRAPCVS